MGADNFQDTEHAPNCGRMPTFNQTISSALGIAAMWCRIVHYQHQNDESMRLSKLIALAGLATQHSRSIIERR